MLNQYLYQFCTHLALKAVLVIEGKRHEQKRPFLINCYLYLIYTRLNERQRQWCQEQLQQQPTPPRKGIWQDEKTGIFYRDAKPIASLAPLDAAILTHLLQHPKQRQTHTQIIYAAWPEADCGGVSTECLYQAICRIRQHIEPMPHQPHYLLNWRGRPEGGYLLFPTGTTVR